MTSSKSAVEAPERTRLLVVEDNEISSRLLQFMLRDTYEVDAAYTVDEALAKAEANAYGLVLMDIDLGERRTGVEVMHQLRRTTTYERVPFVACTAYALPGLGERFLEVGFDGYISKPFTKDHLLEALSVARGITPPPAEFNEFKEQVRIELPPVPASVPRVLELINHSKRSPNVERLKEILKEDPATSEWVVRHVNSAQYAVRQQVSQVEQVVTLLGFVPFCNLVLTELFSQTFLRLDGLRAEFVYDYIIKTSLGAAVFARHLALQTELRTPELAFTGGLLAQLGRLALLSNKSNAYTRLWFAGDGEDVEDLLPPSIGQELLHFGQDHVGLGDRIASAWGLPRELRAIFKHSGEARVEAAGRHLGVVLAVTAGLQAAETLHRVEDDRSLVGPELLASLEALAEHTGTAASNLHYLTIQKAASVRKFVDTVYLEN